MENWDKISQSYLRIELDRLLAFLNRFLGKPTEKVESRFEVDNAHPPAFERFCHLFGLTDFEKQVVLLCAGMQLDREFGDICGEIRGDSSKTWVSFDLARQVFNAGDWLPFSSQSVLRYWDILEPENPKNPNLSPLHLDQSILHYLSGHPVSDPQLESLLLPLPPLSELVDSHHAIANYIVSALKHTSKKESQPIIMLTGKEAESKSNIAMHAISKIGLQPYRIDVEVLPGNTQDLHNLFKRLERDAILHGCAFFFDGEIDEQKPESLRALQYLLKRLSAPCLVATEGSLRGLNREMIKQEVKRPSYQEQKKLWQAAFEDDQNRALSDRLPRLLDQFDLGEQQIKSIGRQWLTELDSGGNCDFSNLWSLCRHQSRHKLKGLARVIEPSPGIVHWGSLVLAKDQMQILHSIVAQVKQRHRVYQEWGFAEKSAFGLGISALFAGVSGTGKTLAARVMASELDLDIYHIDLSAIVSKYIGETEKNLESIFSTAENSGAILLFDEADALFGKRSQVNDSKDRYANMEVSYLLQRMESYKGLSILTTNYKNNMDDAFVRRLRFIVQFPFPQATERAAIWRSVFPENTPVNGLNYEKLARLEIPGGIIRSIAVNAAFHAASDKGKLEMNHILKATQEEFTKSEKTLMPELVADW